MSISNSEIIPQTKYQKEHAEESEMQANWYDHWPVGVREPHTEKQLKERQRLRIEVGLRSAILAFSALTTKMKKIL